MRWHSRKTLFLLVVLVLTLSTVGLGLVWVLGMRSPNRAAYLGVYCGAIVNYLATSEKRTVPDDIRQFMCEYESLAGWGCFPPVSDFPLPEFRPVREPGDGPFLVLIESPPLKCYDFGRWVIYTNSDYQQVAMKNVSPEELPQLRAEDDELRHRARATATSSAPGTAEQAQ